MKYEKKSTRFANNFYVRLENRRQHTNILTSKKARQIAVPYIYSIVLCRNLLSKINIQLQAVEI